MASGFPQATVSGLRIRIARKASSAVARALSAFVSRGFRGTVRASGGCHRQPSCGAR